MQLSAPVITVIILFALIGGYLFDLAADILNLRNLKEKVPEAFKDYYGAPQYLKSQRYLKTNTQFGFVTSTFDIIILLGFWFSGGFNYLDRWVRSFGLNPILTGLLYIGILLLLKLILSIPFNLYVTFVIEEKFGFNKTTPITFLIDLLKTILLSAVFGGLLLSAILWFLEKTGSMAWIFCWIAGAVFLFLVQYLVPTFIMPLFNKFEPLEEGQLKEAIFNYASSIQFPLTHVFVMDGSKRSTKSNAFFTGFGKNKRIVLFDTLIKAHTSEELVAVLAHEMGHYKKKHIVKRLVTAVLQMGLIFFLMSLCISNTNLFQAFFVEQPSIWTGLLFFGMLYSPIDMFLSIVFQIISRKDEIEADLFAAQTLKTPKHLIDALKKLSANNLSNLMPHPLYVFLNYSHPPVLERINKLGETD